MVKTIGQRWRVYAFNDVSAIVPHEGEIVCVRHFHEDEREYVITAFVGDGVSSINTLRERWVSGQLTKNGIKAVEGGSANENVSELDFITIITENDDRHTIPIDKGTAVRERTIATYPLLPSYTIPSDCSLVRWIWGVQGAATVNWAYNGIRAFVVSNNNGSSSFVIDDYTVSGNGVFVNIGGVWKKWPIDAVEVAFSSSLPIPGQSSDPVPLASANAAEALDELTVRLADETEARILRDIEVLRDANAYTDEEVANAVAASHKWLPAVPTFSMLPTMLDPARNYLCKVLDEQIVYQLVAGAAEWTPFSDKTDLVNELELATAIGNHNSSGTAHLDIRTAIDTESQARIQGDINLQWQIDNLPDQRPLAGNGISVNDRTVSIPNNAITDALIGSRTIRNPATDSGNAPAEQLTALLNRLADAIREVRTAIPEYPITGADRGLTIVGGNVGISASAVTDAMLGSRTVQNPAAQSGTHAVQVTAAFNNAANAIRALRTQLDAFQELTETDIQEIIDRKELIELIIEELQGTSALALAEIHQLIDALTARDQRPLAGNGVSVNDRTVNLANHAQNNANFGAATAVNWGHTRLSNRANATTSDAVAVSEGAAAFREFPSIAAVAAVVPDMAGAINLNHGIFYQNCEWSIRGGGSGLIGGPDGFAASDISIKVIKTNSNTIAQRTHMYLWGNSTKECFHRINANTNNSWGAWTRVPHSVLNIIPDTGGQWDAASVQAVRNFVEAQIATRAPVNTTLTNAAPSSGLPAITNLPLTTLLQQTRNFLRGLIDWGQIPDSSVYIEAGTNVNTLRRPGHYFIANSSIARSLLNTPSDFLALAVTGEVNHCIFTVSSTASNTQIQTIRSLQSFPLDWERVIWGTGANQQTPWIRVLSRADIETRAPINSPTFTGVPDVPAASGAVAAAATPTAAQNTRIATVGQIAATRNAINGDRAPLASPTFTGVPTVPTPPTPN